MKKVLLFVLMSVMLVSGCSRVTVPPAAKGKLLSASGYSVDVKESGKYWVVWWNSMVILDTSTSVVTEKITVKMKDKLDMKVDVRFRTRIAGNEKTINAMFSDIKHENYQVTLPLVYNVYGRDVVRSVGRSVLSKYTAEEVPENFDRITEELRTEITKALAKSPIEMSNVTLGTISYPETITEAINAQAERRLAIETEENQQAIELVKKANALALAKADYEIRMTRAKAVRDENKMTADGLNPILLQYRALEVQEQMAKNQNAVFVPYESLTSSGLQNRIYK